MRRTAVILAVCGCALAGCRGSAAQEPYDGLLATRANGAVPPALTQAPEPEAIASEVDVPWTIAVLSDAKQARAKARKPAGVVEPTSYVVETVPPDGDLHVAVDHEPGERAATPKTCSGVVNRRS
jgi:hypothetical protein